MKVIVSFGERRKWVTFFSGLQGLRSAFHQLLERDPLCKEAFLGGKIIPIEPERIIFQWPVDLEDPSSPLVEIEEDDPIPDRYSNIRAFYQTKFCKSNFVTNYTISQFTAANPVNESAVATAEGQSPVHTESNIILSVPFGSVWNGSPDNSSLSQISLSESPVMVPVNATMEENEDLSASESVDNSEEAEHGSSSKVSPNSVSKGMLTYPCELPCLSEGLAKAREEGKLHVKRRQFIKEMKTFLIQKVPVPTKAHYQVFSRTVVDTYPEFRTKDPGLPYWSGFKNMLVGSIACSRYYARHTDKRRSEARQRYKEHSQSKKPRSENAEPDLVADPLVNLERELLEGNVLQPERIKFLLENTFEKRREYLQDVQDPAAKCAIVPFLRKIDTAFMELKLILPVSAREQLLPNFHLNFNRLVDAFKRLENLREKDPCMVLLKVNDSLVHFRLKRQEPSFVVPRRVGDTSPFPPASTSTFAVIYTEGSVIKSFSIVVVDQVFFSVENTSIPLSYVVLLLLTTYRILSIQFPKDYNILHIIDRFCLSGVVDITVHQKVLKAAEKLTKILERE